MADETKPCPWCGETILAVAKKCKHCGEYLTDERPDVSTVVTATPARGAPQPRVVEETDASSASAFECSRCSEAFTTDRERYLHTVNVHGVLENVGRSSSSVAPVWRYHGFGGWRCIEHDKVFCGPCRARVPIPGKVAKKGAVFPDPNQTTSPKAVDGQRRKLSEVASHTDDGVLKCPKCGSTQFTAKRSMKGKIIGGTIGVATLGVVGPAAAALAPKSMVKCVACGTMYKRG